MDDGPIRVLCVDDSVELTRALAKLIRMQPDLEDAGSLTNADDLVAQVERHRASVVLIDLNMPGTPPLEAIKELARRVPTCRAIAYSGDSGPETIDLALEAGAWACLSKLTEPRQVLEVIRQTAQD